MIELNGTNEIKGYVEKPVFNYRVSMGIYVFEPGVLRHIPKNTYMDFPNLVLQLIEAKEKVISYPFNGYWQDLGRPDDYAAAHEQFPFLRRQILGIGE